MKPKKHLGQNFLTRDHYARVMVEAANVNENDTIIEIGPGKGILTAVLLEKSKKVIAIEKDKELYTFLSNKFPKEISSGKLELLLADALRFELRATRYKLVSNIPYNITGEILRHFLSANDQPLSMTLMVQKEVAERIIARNPSKQIGRAGKKESVLSISVKAYGEPKIIARVAAGNFFPKPSVDSAVLHISDISRKFFEDIDEQQFFRLVHAGFAHKRKQLLGNLRNAEYTKEILERIFNECDISSSSRAEELTLDSWKSLVQNLI